MISKESLSMERVLAVWDTTLTVVRFCPPPTRDLGVAWSMDDGGGAVRGHWTAAWRGPRSSSSWRAWCTILRHIHGHIRDTSIDMSAGMSTHISMDVSTDISKDKFMDTSIGVSTAISMGISLDVSMDVCMDISFDISMETSMDTSVDVSMNISMDESNKCVQAQSVVHGIHLHAVRGPADRVSP
jgi:hypothetical protein